MKLWEKLPHQLHPLIEKYTVSDDYLLDQILLPYDIKGTIAHAKGLYSIGIFNKKELKQIRSILSLLQKEYQEGKVKLSVTDEDSHTFIENYLSEKLPKIGQKIHTGRSRNDQILLVIRLFMRDKINTIKKAALKVSQILLKNAKKFQKTPFPGYTHTQQAMLGAVGHYFAAFLESLLDDIELLDTIAQHLNKNPLGSVAGFGVSLNLNRELTTKELKFDKVQINSLYCQNSRGKFESLFLEGLCQIIQTIGKLANDLIIFTSKEFDFFYLPNYLLTGSSIMPQKNNYDALEIMRANVSVLFNHQHLIKDLSHKVLSGYNRDFQLMKKPIIESSTIVLDSLEVLSLFLKKINPKKDKINTKINLDIIAADIANQLVLKNKIPFREAYHQALKKLPKKINFQKNISKKISLGAAGNLHLNHYQERIKNLLKKFG